MKKFSNKILIITLAILVAIFVLSRVFRSPGLESNLRKELVTLDTAKVTEVQIRPTTTKGNEIKLIREGTSWNVSADGKQAKAEGGTVESMLGVIMNLKSQRMVSRKKEKWETFQVGEESTHVTVYANKEKVADFRVGKTGFNQSQQGGGGFNGGFTYVRMDGENEVYVTEGFLASHFNRDYNGWRDKTFLRLNKEEITHLSFHYPDSSFVLEKRDSSWYDQTQLVEASKVDPYLNQLQFKNVSEFADGFTPSSTAPLSIQIDGASGNLATVQAWPGTLDEEWVLSSTLQSGVYFKAKKSGVVKDIFVGPQTFH